MASKSQRMADAGLSPNKAYPKKAAAPVKKSAPAKKSSSAAVKSKFSSSMSVPGSARPASSAAPSGGRTSFAGGAKKSIPAFGRDRFGSKPTVRAGVPGLNRQELEAKSMSAMRRDRLGPGQK